MRVRMLVVLLSLAACGSNTTADAGADAGEPDAGSGCSSNPMTHLELINACTTAKGIVRTPNLPLLQADGGVPPLP